MIPSRLVLGTGNPGKVAELAALARNWGDVEVLSLAQFPRVALPDETADSYAANALSKARAVAGPTGLPALADDSGLEVDALGGAPGLHSARWAGSGASDADRVAKLLRALDGVTTRTARFRCAVALVWPDGREEVAEGEVAGRIALEPAGTGGFGYDPVFVADELGRPFAVATSEEKGRLSHRARAMRALGDRLRRPA
jgi:XTP/dITP diphosphohydrolase